MNGFRKVLALALLASISGLAWVPGAQAQTRAYRTTDTSMRQLINRIENRSDRFSRSLERALDVSSINGTAREDEINRMVTDFEYATDRLKDNFNARRSAMADAQEVLARAAALNNVMNSNRFANAAERDWTLLRTELDQLARNYNVAWNWNNYPSNGGYYPGTGTSYPGSYDAQLTGTYRLNVSQSNNVQVIADQATRGLNNQQRQRVHDNLVRRLQAPDMLAIERRGNSVTLASTNSPQVTFNVDDREHVETYPNGRTSRARASWEGDGLTVVTNGDRANDFTVKFDPTNNGRRLVVTRQVYVERLSRPVTVQSYYDRTSDVAQLNLYNGSPTWNNGPTYGDVASGSFIIPNGTQVVASLNNSLDTQNTREGDRFTMTVQSPSQYAGAVIEGHVSNVARGGRVTGRSQLTLDFDRIRLRNGQSYEFAGILSEVRQPNGEIVRVDNEGAVQEENRTNTTLTRTAIGTAVGALIGAIAGGGKGAAIGAVVGAGAGAGSVYVQGQDDLELSQGSVLVINASAPR